MWDWNSEHASHLSTHGRYWNVHPQHRCRFQCYWGSLYDAIREADLTESINAYRRGQYLLRPVPRLPSHDESC
ncbi:hypothetical protein M404DRAFT_998768 [Pisolithus tinctorius Marx 270]|uniref:Uncharacterized protein n=1 Tax=Pisolithus tinctorius Marx 270 TaxID=870435 RepID=A0A0C3JC09_PISTI|nr:hypothetical protein M404DRAFT_998768 [Pisolithus tinctorius Marx 270]